MPPHIRLQPSTVKPISFWRQLHMKRGQIGWTRQQHNFAYAALITATPFKSQRTRFQFTPTKTRLSISLLPILQPLLKLTFPRYTIYYMSLPPSLPSLTFYVPLPPSFTRFCDGHWDRTGWILSLTRGDRRLRPPQSAVAALASASNPLATPIRGQRQRRRRRNHHIAFQRLPRWLRVIPDGLVSSQV